MAELYLSDSSILFDAKNIKMGFGVCGNYSEVDSKRLNYKQSVIKLSGRSWSVACFHFEQAVSKVPNIFLICSICDHF